MKFRSTIILFLYSGLLFSQTIELPGTYSSVNNKFERWSIMKLNNDGTFSYNYGVGGCQATVTGTYKVDNTKIEFKNDSEFLSKSDEEQFIIDSLMIAIPTYYYPNLGLSHWRIGKDFIKPLSSIDTGCLEESGKHKRIY
jgi:hypothetical protein